MTYTARQVAQVEGRLWFTCVSNSNQVTYRNQRVVNIKASTTLAFVLGVRFALMQPYRAGDYMGAWFKERTLESSTTDVAERHGRALGQIILPLHMEVEDTDDDDYNY